MWDQMWGVTQTSVALNTWKKVILNIMWSSIDVCEWWRSRFAASGHVVAKRITLPTMIGSTSASESSVE